MEIYVKVRVMDRGIQHLSVRVSLGALLPSIPLEITPVVLQTPQVQPDSQGQYNSETWMDGWMDG